MYDKKTGGITRLENRAGDERSLPNNTVTTLYRDGSGVMWVGTYKKGVACYDESIYKFGLTPLGDVTFIEQAKDGALWLGINDGGLMRWNPADGGRQQFGHQGEASLTANVIISLLQARDGRLWIGTFWGGLDCYDGHRFTHYRHREGDANSLADNNVWTLAEDGEGNIWIGTLGGGIQRLDPRTGTFTTYTAASCGIASDYIASICMDCNNRLIVGTASSGISILDLKTGRATNLADTPACRHRLSSQSINQVYEDSRGLIWIATRAGLNLYDEAGGSMQLVSFPQGIANPFISGIAEDHNHNLWVSTSAGVVNIVLQKGAEGYGFDFHLYDNRDGLQGSGFNQRAIKCLDSGEIAMGGLYGLNVFHPDGIKYNRTLPKVLFTGLRLFNKEVEIGKEYDGGMVLEKSLNQSGEVVLRYKQNVFTVLFASDSYVLPEKTTYYYKLEGFDEEWLASPSEVHRATYTNLAPGKYLLRVKAVNSDGLAGTEEAVLKIAILPPFWRTTWAYIGYALQFAGALLLAFYAVHRRERNRFRLRQLEEDAKKKEELNQMKFRFFTNVSHELRTPLTLILSPLESMMREAEDGQQKRRLSLMHRNAQRLLMLVNQLLDFRKIEMAGMHLTLSEGDLVSYVRNICNSFLMLSERKHVRLTFSSAMEYLNMSFDEDKIGKVVMNLLSNAFKFTPEGGRVDVTVELHPQVAGRVLVKVADTGIGIRDEDKRHIFERFYQVEQEELARQSTGSGIGLSLVYDFVTLHGGTVRVEDNTGAGSVFIVELPVRQVPEEEPLPEEGGGAQPEEGKAAADKPLVLIVDDNEDLVAFMEESLNLYYRVKPAANGRLAWQMIPDLMPDLIVSDVMMPEMDGNELCRRVKGDKRTKHIPLILLTAKQAVEDKVEGLTIGADDYVTKPFNMEVLVLRIRKLMELSRRDKGRRQIDPEPSKIEITSLDEQLVANGIKYVEENMARPELSVEELSQAMGMSRVHLYKKLLQITGKSPTEFIRIIRLKRAAQLLRESQLNVSEIAYRVGFNNPKYFSKYFKDEFGISPSVYQEREEK